jgi:DNA-binding winged helix-turn-helix (wHTH) protein
MIVFRAQGIRFLLDLHAGQLWRDRERIHLPRKEWDVLRYPAENPGKLVSKDELHQMVWPDAHVGPAAIDRAVSEVRQALGNRADDPLFIETVRGRGYAPAPQSWSSMCSHRERSFVAVTRLPASPPRIVADIC